MMDGTETEQFAPPLLLDEREAARRLRISPRGLWQLRADRMIAFVKIGGRILYRPSDLEAFIDRQTRPATAQEPTPAEDFSEKGGHGA